jgi:hypothetical protein
MAIEKLKYEKDTVGYWLKWIASTKIRTRAFNNASEIDLELSCTTMQSAISSMCDWSASPEGTAFWGAIHDKITRENHGALWDICKGLIKDEAKTKLKPDGIDNGHGLVFKDGIDFSAMIRGQMVTGKISIARMPSSIEYSIFLCQNDVEGCQADDLKGYRYSWCIFKGTPTDLRVTHVTKLVLGSPADTGLVSSPEIAKAPESIYPNNTVGYYLNQIADLEIRGRAFRAVMPSDVKQSTYSLPDAIDKIGHWSSTLEGYNFWSTIYHGSNIDTLLNNPNAFDMFSHHIPATERIRKFSTGIIQPTTITTKTTTNGQTINVQPANPTITNGKRFSSSGISGRRSKVATSIGSQCYAKRSISC